MVNNRLWLRIHEPDYQTLSDEGRRDALRSDSKMNHEGIILGLVGELELQDGQDRSSRKIEPTAGEKNQNKKGNKKKLTSRGLHLSAPA